jgi:hypothetical protein
MALAVARRDIQPSQRCPQVRRRRWCVAPYFEQGNWYRGGAVRCHTWLYGQQNQVRPMFGKDATQEDLIRASKSFDLALTPPVDWSEALRHLPVGIFSGS